MSTDLITFIISTSVGAIAAIFGIVGIIPQAIIVAKSKDTASISLWMYILYVVGCTIWIIWSFGFLFLQLVNFNNGYYEPDVTLWTIILYNLPTLLLNWVGLLVGSIILGYKIKNLILSKKFKISEHQLAMKLKKDKK